MSSDASVTQWIDALRAGDTEAAQKLWERYFERLVSFASKKLGAAPRRAADEEDVVISAFNSFCLGVAEGRFPKLDDRDDLWRVLMTITERKVSDQLKHAVRQKRGGGKVRGESAFLHPDDSTAQAGINQVGGCEPTPEFAALMAEQFEELLGSLQNEDIGLREVALLKLEGYTNKEIAARIGRTTRSVERKLQRIRLVWSEEAPPPPDEQGPS